MPEASQWGSERGEFANIHMLVIAVFLRVSTFFCFSLYVGEATHDYYRSHKGDVIVGFHASFGILIICSTYHL